MAKLGKLPFVGDGHQSTNKTLHIHHVWIPTIGEPYHMNPMQLNHGTQPRKNGTHGPGKIRRAGPTELRWQSVEIVLLGDEHP